MLNVNNQINKIPMLWNLFFGSLDVSFCLIGLALTRGVFTFFVILSDTLSCSFSLLSVEEKTLFYHGPQLARCRFFFASMTFIWSDLYLLDVNFVIETTSYWLMLTPSSCIFPQHSNNLHARYIPEPRSTSTFSIMIYIKITYKTSQGHKFCLNSLFTIFGI